MVMAKTSPGTSPQGTSIVAARTGPGARPSTQAARPANASSARNVVGTTHRTQRAPSGDHFFPSMLTPVVLRVHQRGWLVTSVREYPSRSENA